MNVKNLFLKLHPIERKILRYLDKLISFEELVKKTKISSVECMRALEWLENKKIIELKKTFKKVISLDTNGFKYIEEGLPEKRVLKCLNERCMNKEEIIKCANVNENEFNVSIGILRKYNAISISDNKFCITENGRRMVNKGFLEEKFLNELAKQKKYVDDLNELEKFCFHSLKKRYKIIKVSEEKGIIIKPREIVKELRKFKDIDVIEKLTPELLKSKEWKKKEFRHYDVAINVPKRYCGKIHFINDVIDYVRRIWLDMGFKEMKGTLIQTAFWNLDALFVPQDHPVREMQDTFYLEKGYFLEEIDKEILNRVKKVHENGYNTGSKGWNYKYDESKAKELVLRTHTTVLSAKTIANLKEIPSKFFAIGKVFRNETIDWKHLFEFYQVEGIVVDKNANFCHLKFYLTMFYKKMGYNKIRIKPSYFPYTEPSVEIEVYNEDKKEWVELGGAGIFRPEVTKTLIGEEIPVLAWGLGLGRIILPFYNIKDIRELYKNDLKKLREMKRFVR